MVRLGKKQSIMGALYKGFWTAAILGAVAIYLRHADTCSAT